MLAAAAALAALWLSGCPLLMVGSLGYSGYQYEKGEGPFAKQTAAPRATKKAAAAKTPIPNNEIE